MDKKFLHVYRFVRLLQDIFNNTLLLQFASSLLMITMIGFQIIGVNNQTFFKNRWIFALKWCFRWYRISVKTIQFFRSGTWIEQERVNRNCESADLRIVPAARLLLVRHGYHCKGEIYISVIFLLRGSFWFWETFKIEHFRHWIHDK